MYSIRTMSTKATYQPSKVKRARKHGFLARTATKSGANILKARRRKGRAMLTVQPTVKRTKVK